MLYTTNMKAQYNEPKYYNIDTKGFVVETDNLGFSLYLPNDIITVLPTYTLDTFSMMWVVVSDKGPIIKALGCECEVKPFIELLMNYPMSKEDKANKFYSLLILDKWKD